MSDFKVPKETMDVLYKRFRDRDRRLIAQDILQIDHKLSTDERHDLTKKYGTDVAKVRKVEYALRDLSLITEKEGSMPLYEHRLRLEQASKFPKILESPIPLQTEDDQNEPDNPPDTEERTGNPPMEEAEDPLPDASTRMRTDVERLKVQFGGLNTRKDGFETQLGDISSKINLIVDMGS